MVLSVPRKLGLAQDRFPEEAVLVEDLELDTARVLVESNWKCAWLEEL
jgi:hypothetical protein